MSKNEIAEIHKGGEMVVMPQATKMAEVLQQDAEIRKVLKKYIETSMVNDIDFGTIPGTNKPTLLQPGAEKLCEIFRCTPEYEVTNRVEKWDGTNLFHYEFSCKLVSRDTNGVVAEGVGICSSRESRYRWRNAKRKCPKCGIEAICKSNFPPRDNPQAEPGWYCYAKIQGCGAQFEANDKSITGQEVGRVENEDVADQINTILKMAKKRALVDAAITLARRYGWNYSQDMEDMTHGDEPAAPAKAAEPAKTEPPKKEPAKRGGKKAEEAAKPTIATGGDHNLTVEEKEKVWQLIRQAGDGVIEKICKHFAVASIDVLPRIHYEMVINNLNTKIAKDKAAAEAEAAKKRQAEIDAANAASQGGSGSGDDIPWA